MPPRFIDILESQKFPRGILIYKTSMTPSANKVGGSPIGHPLSRTSPTDAFPLSRQVITAMAQQFTIEAFQESELLVNITQHVLVPRHEVLSPEDKKTLLTR